MSSRRAERSTPFGIAALAIAVGVIATRRGMRLTPDSVTYLAAARHLRGGAGYTDITGEPLTVFPPVLPSMLAIGDGSMWWARGVAVMCGAVAAALLWSLLRLRVGYAAATMVAVAYAVARGTVWLHHHVWSDGPALALGLVVLVYVLRRIWLRPAQAMLVGGLCGVGLLLRYGSVLVLAAAAAAVWWGAGDRTDRLARLGWMATACSVAFVPWLVHNQLAEGRPLGPRGVGGSPDGARQLGSAVVRSIGFHALPAKHTPTTLLIAGLTVAAATTGGLVFAWRSQVNRRFTATMTAWVVAAVAVPVLARRFTGSDIEPRVMAPVIIGGAVVLALVLDRVLTRERRWAHRCSYAALAVWLVAALPGVNRPIHAPSLADRDVYSASLHAAIDELPPGVRLITNNPWGVWWLNRRDPVHPGFVAPVAGLSHEPLTVEATLELVCRGDAYLAWFSTLRNARKGPLLSLPGVATAVRLTTVQRDDTGVLYSLSPVAECPTASS